jgi:hypothetical protein
MPENSGGLFFRLPEKILNILIQIPEGIFPNIIIHFVNL